MTSSNIIIGVCVVVCVYIFIRLICKKTAKKNISSPPEDTIERKEEKVADTAIPVAKPSKINLDPNILNNSIFMQAVDFAVCDGTISAATLQRRLKIGYARAMRTIEELEQNGIISSYNNNLHQRKALIGLEEWERIKRTLPPVEDISTLDLYKIQKEYKPYIFPPITDIARPLPETQYNYRDKIETIVRKIEAIFANNGVAVRVITVKNGPVNVRFEAEYASGENIKSIYKLKNVIENNIGVDSIIIEKNNPYDCYFTIIATVIIHTVTLREVLESSQFNQSSILPLALGKDESGTAVVCDLAKMPHLLVTGQSGIGKSNCVHSFITSILYNSSPDAVKFILVDPSVEEHKYYNGVPHLIVPVVNDPMKVSSVLLWLVSEIKRRFSVFAEYNARNIESYNNNCKANQIRPLERIVLFIDGLDGIPNSMTVVESLYKITSDGTKAGLHLVATAQNPQSPIIEKIICNIPSKIFFKGKYMFSDKQNYIRNENIKRLSLFGNMIYSPQNCINGELVRGCYISKEEIYRVTRHVKDANPSTYNPDILEQLDSLSSSFTMQMGTYGTTSKDYSFNNAAGYQYEEYVANWLKSQGYTQVDVTPKSGDYGADIICISPFGRKTAVQCKLQSKPVGYSAVQQVVSGMLYYKCSESMVVTNNTFTEQARDGARELNVRLIDSLM